MRTLITTRLECILKRAREVVQLSWQEKFVRETSTE
jgi:hypothetical protein